MDVFRVINWRDNFESAESRKATSFPWIKLPTKQGGDGYTCLLTEHKNGTAHFGAWTALLQLAAKCAVRGVLVRQIGTQIIPHDFKSMSRIIRVPVEVLAEAMPRLLEIGWMEVVDLQKVMDAPAQPGENRATSGKKQVLEGEGEGEGEKEGEGEGEASPSPPASPILLESPSGKPLSDQSIANRKRLLAALKKKNVALEIKDAPIFMEWIAVVDGYQLNWIEHVIETARGPLRYPSQLRKIFKSRDGEYQTWKLKNNKKEG